MNLSLKAPDDVALEVRSAYARCAYRVVDPAWSPGHHRVFVRLGVPGTESLTTAARRVARGERDTEHRIVVSSTWSGDVLARGAAVVDGMLTLHLGQEVDPGIRQAVWVEQGRGIRLASRRGYLVERASGWTHADSAQAARIVRAEPPEAPLPKGMTSLPLLSVLQRLQLRGTEDVTVAIAHDDGRGAPLASIRDWAARRNIDLKRRPRISARELLDLALQSQDRVGCICRVLRRAQHVTHERSAA